MNPAYQPYLNAHRARARLALALKERGWEIFGYTEGDPNATDEVNLAHWHGYAKHPDYPDVIVVCGISDSNEQTYRRLDWADKFKANWANGWYYHIEFEGKYKTMGSGTSWAGDMSEQGKASVKTHADYITERAQKYIAKRGRGIGIRLGVKTTGCSGLAYKLEYADESQPEDLVFESFGTKVLIDPKSLSVLDGTELDFQREGLNEGFKFNNPREKARCGCGESFTV